MVRWKLYLITLSKIIYSLGNIHTHTHTYNVHGANINTLGGTQNAYPAAAAVYPDAALKEGICKYDKLYMLLCIIYCLRWTHLFIVQIVSITSIFNAHFIVVSLWRFLNLFKRILSLRFVSNTLFLLQNKGSKTSQIVSLPLNYNL